MCHESEYPHVSCISFEHGNITYYITYLFEKSYECCLDMYRGEQNLYLGLSFCYNLC